MASPAKFYAKSTHQKLGKIYHATWMPNEIVKLGSVGVLQDKYFFRSMTSLDNLGVSFNAVKATVPNPLDLSFESGTSITLKAAGETNAALPSIPVAKAGIGIEFSRNGAFVVRAAESFADTIDDIPALGAQIRQLAQNGSWSKEWVVVVKQTRCTAATIVISRSSSSKIEFAIDGTLPAGASPLGNASINLGMTKQTNAVFSFENARDITPFIQLARLQSNAMHLLGASAAGAQEAAQIGADDHGGLGAMSPNEFKAAAGNLEFSVVRTADDGDDE